MTSPKKFFFGGVGMLPPAPPLNETLVNVSEFAASESALSNDEVSSEIHGG